MAVPASQEALRLTGNLAFGAGGMAVEFLTGTFVKSASVVGTTLTIVLQDTNGAEQTITFTGGSGGGITLEEARDTIAAMLTAGTNVTIDYVDDGTGVGTLTVNATGGGGVTTLG